jgi:hypothetical protein
MADHCTIICGEAHIKFEPITAMLKGQVEGGMSVLSNSK